MSKNYKRVKILTILLIILLCTAIVLIITYFGIEYGGCENIYKMPNDVICRVSKITGGGFGGATHEFKWCSDKKTYINPEYYKKEWRCKR